MMHFVLLILCVPLPFAYILNPEPTIEAALQGIVIWRDILLPVLFPFFVLIELLQGFGVVRLVGVLFEKMMRTLFRLPGCSGFILLMGILGGYPIAAKLTAKLHRDGELTRNDAERLVGSITSADPVFIIGAVAIGFLHNESVAPILIVAQYSASIFILVLSAIFATKQPTTTSTQILFKRIKSAWFAHRLLEIRRPSQILRDAIEHALPPIFMIGGLVMFFCVYVSLLTSMQIMNYFYSIAYVLLTTFSDTIPGLSQALIDGMFEVTLGIQSVSTMSGVTQIVQLTTIGFILSWAGLSVHAQIMSLLQGSAVRYLPFVMYRVIHGMIAATVTLVIWPFFQAS